MYLKLKLSVEISTVMYQKINMATNKFDRKQNITDYGSAKTFNRNC